MLQSHALQTGAREIAAGGAGPRAAGARAGATPVLRLSVIKTLELLRPWWLTLELGRDLLSARQKQPLTGKFLELARRGYVTPRRKQPRSGPRAVRQPVSRWPRRRRNQSGEGPLHFKLLQP